MRLAGPRAVAWMLGPRRPCPTRSEGGDLPQLKTARHPNPRFPLTKRRLLWISPLSIATPPLRSLISSILGQAAIRHHLPREPKMSFQDEETTNPLIYYPGVQSGTLSSPSMFNQKKNAPSWPVNEGTGHVRPFLFNQHAGVRRIARDYMYKSYLSNLNRHMTRL